MTRERISLPAVLFLLAFSAAAAHAQGVAINTSGAAADTSAILELATTNKGFLPPRMTGVQRSAIVLPATGLVVYQTDGVAGLYWNAGTPGAPSWKQVGEAGVGGSSQWVTNGSNIYYSAGNVGIQRTSPLARLDVLGGNWDVVNSEGDFRIGDATTRLKIGIATGGGGTGSATIMEHGPAGAYNVLSLGTQGTRVVYVNGVSQRVGIGTDAPNAPLGFPAVLGKKITLYPGATGDVGIGVSGSRLQLYADHPGADVAVGYDQAGTFNERFAFKPTGALAVMGNTGAAGQVLQSNGAASAATWVSPTASLYDGTSQLRTTGSVTLNTNAGRALVPGLDQNLYSAGNSKVLISFSVPIQASSCFACGGPSVFIDVEVDGGMAIRYPYSLGNGVSFMSTGTYLATVGPGWHNYRMTASVAGQDTYVGLVGTLTGNMVLQAIPQ